MEAGDCYFSEIRPELWFDTGSIRYTPQGVSIAFGLFLCPYDFTERERDVW